MLLRWKVCDQGGDHEHVLGNEHWMSERANSLRQFALYFKLATQFLCVRHVIDLMTKLRKSGASSDYDINVTLDGKGCEEGLRYLLSSVRVWRYKSGHWERSTVRCP